MAFAGGDRLDSTNYAPAAILTCLCAGFHRYKTTSLCDISPTPPLCNRYPKSFPG
jgi:hypothetical protein